MMFVIIATTPNFPPCYRLADNPIDAKKMVDELTELCWRTEVKYVPVINDIVIR